MKKPLVFGLILLVTVSILPQIAFAQPSEKYQYAVKVICGYSDGKILDRGTYRTAVNVYSDTTDKLVMKIVLIEPEIAARIFYLESVSLEPDRAIELDCGEICEAVQGICEKYRFLKGFLILQSQFEVDVVAVYTAGGLFRKVTSMDVERISPRKLPRY